MKNIDGIYKVDMLGPFGWEHFSTAFIHDGEYRSASAEHFTHGTYAAEDHGFQMEGNLTQHADHRPLFGRKDIKELPIKFIGRIDVDVIDGEARVTDGSRHSLRFRLNRLPSLN
ncbi:MAG: hypothetical protein KJP11_05120 [Gammaproteobacteria bacterium]|nr:hypothetical protein [Gammaproteobacteria bacterium]